MLLSGNLQGGQHLGIPALDIHRAKEWYTNVCGFEVIHEPIVSTDEGNIYVAFLKLGNLSLECYQLAGAAREEIASRKHGHIDHFAIDVTDIDQAMSDALAAGAKLDAATPDGPILLDTFFSQGAKYVVFTGPTGEKVEFNQRMDLDPKRRRQNMDGWAHLGIPVTNIESSRAFYRQFGFEDIMYAEIPVDSEAVKAVMIQKEDFVIELYQLVGAEREEIGTRKDGHIDHIALNVADIDSAFAELRAAGFTTLEESPVALDFWDNGCKYFNVRGPDGEKLEFNQIIQ